MLTRFQVMAIATAIEQHAKGDISDIGVGTSRLCDIIRTAAQEMAYDHENPLDALKQAESHLTDAINMLDQANDRHKTTTALGKKADAVMGELQTLIRYMEHEPEEDPDREDDDDGPWSGGFADNH
jgi:hypothetical protein